MTSFILRECIEIIKNLFINERFGFEFVQLVVIMNNKNSFNKLLR